MDCSTFSGACFPSCLLPTPFCDTLVRSSATPSLHAAPPPLPTMTQLCRLSKRRGGRACPVSGTGARKVAARPPPSQRHPAELGQRFGRRGVGGAGEVRTKPAANPRHASKLQRRLWRRRPCRPPTVSWSAVAMRVCVCFMYSVVYGLCVCVCCYVYCLHSVVRILRLCCYDLQLVDLSQHHPLRSCSWCQCADRRTRG